jgi:elongation factor 2
MGDLQCLANKGNVAFGSGKEQWAFTITRFARIYAAKFKTDAAKLMDRFWGDNYFDAENKKWTKDSESETGK